MFYPFELLCCIEWRRRRPKGVEFADIGKLRHLSMDPTCVMSVEGVLGIPEIDLWLLLKLWSPITGPHVPASRPPMSLVSLFLRSSPANFDSAASSYA